MKKLLSLILVISSLTLFSSCEGIFGQEYTITGDYYWTGDDLFIYEYNNAEERVGSHTINNLVSGKEYTFTASSNAEKVKIRYYSNGNYSWVRHVFYLDDITEIELNGSTMVGTREP